jgi:hypothetical protein
MSYGPATLGFRDDAANVPLSAQAAMLTDQALARIESIVMHQNGAND